MSKIRSARSPMLCVLAIFPLGGCNLAPTYVRPALPVPASLPADASPPLGESPQPPLAEVGWQDFFTDARLRRVIDQALNNNRDMRVAVDRVEQARALNSGQRADLLPNVGAGGSGTLQRVTRDQAALYGGGRPPGSWSAGAEECGGGKGGGGTW